MSKGPAPQLDYAEGSTRRLSTWARINVGLMCFAAVLALAAIFSTFELRGPWTFRGGARIHDNAVHCASNLRMIGQAILIYRNENAGVYPPDFAALIRDVDIGAESFICHSSNDTRAAPGQGLGAVLADFALPGHCSYIYCGAGLDAVSEQLTMIIAYEPLGHHDSGSNVLFADGHVEFISPIRMPGLIAQLEAGRNPPSPGILD